jgi:putative endonuclease
LARALAWHVRGHRFDPDILHLLKGSVVMRTLFILWYSKLPTNMPFYCYILHSQKLDQYYIGHTEDVDNRLFRHNNSGSKATKKANDWTLVYKQEYSSRSEAMKAEMAIKKKKSRKYIEKLISSVG